MYLLSLYFQNPAALGFSPLEAGVATLPATVGLVVVAPLVPRLANRLGGRQVIGVGFIAMAAGFAVIGLVDSAWAYTAFLLPILAIAVGMGLSNGPASSAATASVPQEQVGGASGVSNMARYVGAAVATALCATIYASVQSNQLDDGASAGDAWPRAWPPPRGCWPRSARSASSSPWSRSVGTRRPRAPLGTPPPRPPRTCTRSRPLPRAAGA